MNKKIIFIATFLGQLILASTLNANVLSNEHFSSYYVVPDHINAQAVVREQVVDDLQHDRTHCQDKVPQLVDLVFTGSVYGPRYGQRTFYVDVYYSCPVT